MLDDSLQALQIVAGRLGPLLGRVVFLGGAVANLLVTDKGVLASRVTRDIDVIVDLASRTDYALFLRPKLIELGFRETMDSSVICRWLVDGIEVDIMSADATVFGFANRWYRAALATPNTHVLPDGQTIRVISGPCFLATKLEAFKDRGHGDYQASMDLEDVVTILDGRVEIEEELASAPVDVREFISSELRRHLAERRFHDALPGHLGGDARIARLVELLMRV